MDFDYEDDIMNICQGPDTRNKQGTSDGKKRWNIKEAAKRQEQIQKRRDQADRSQEKAEDNGMELRTREKKYTNGKPKRVRQQSPVLIEEDLKEVRPNKKMERNMRRE